MSLTRSNRLRSSCVVSGVRPRLELLLRQHLRRAARAAAAAPCVSFFGVCTCTVANRSPRPRPLTSGIPLPRSRSVVPVCVPSGTLTRLGAVERRHLDLAAERDGGEVHRDLAEQVVAVAAEELVLLHVDDDVEVAGGPAGRRRLRLRSAAGAAGRWRCPAGILTVIFRSRATRPAPRQVAHGLVMILPAPRHCGQVRATVKKPC